MDSESNNGKGHYKLLFRVRRSIRYHSQRQKHYTSLHNVVLFFALCLSSVSIVAFATAVGKDWSLWVKLSPAALVSILSAADLVFGYAQKAWLHADFVRKFTDLERRLLTPEGKNPASITDVQDQVLEIEAAEPPVLQVLDTLCRNELMRAEGASKDQQITVGFFQRLFSDFTDLRAHTLYKEQASSKT